jgi:hypothetical protein
VTWKRPPPPVVVMREDLSEPAPVVKREPKRPLPSRADVEALLGVVERLYHIGAAHATRSGYTCKAGFAFDTCARVRERLGGLL